MKRFSQFEVGWLVGLVEGDGSITFDGKHPVVCVSMTDFDTVLRFAELVGTTVMGPYKYEGELGDKERWTSKIAGQRARDFMVSTCSLFSLRRQQQIRNILGDQIQLDIPAYRDEEAA